jgi:hypothetical protein
VLGQADAGREVVVAEEDLPERAVGGLVLPRPAEAENLHVPRRARLGVPDGEAQVVDSLDHGSILPAPSHRG